MALTKADRRQRIKYRIRKKLSGSGDRPRMTVFRSNKQIYVQLVDDLTGKTLGAASSKEKEIASQKVNKVDQAKLVGKRIAEVAKEKGIDVLIDAIDKVVSDSNGIGTDRNIKLVFAGPYGDDVIGEEEYYLKIKDQLRSAQWIKDKKNSYNFFGSLHDGKLGAFYDVIDVLVLPSTNRTEAFGMVQVEAMQLGTPVIASNIPGVRVPVKETEMGAIVDPGDVSGLADALNSILSKLNTTDNKLKSKKAKEKFNIQSTYDFYRSLLLDDRKL